MKMKRITREKQKPIPEGQYVAKLEDVETKRSRHSYQTYYQLSFRIDKYDETVYHQILYCNKKVTEPFSELNKQYALLGIEREHLDAEEVEAKLRDLIGEEFYVKVETESAPNDSTHLCNVVENVIRTSFCQ